ncbi:MAG: hypothetical protein ACI4CS_04720 [Candidatus Weimeria sp.]
MDNKEDCNTKGIRLIKHGYTAFITACIIYMFWWFINYFPASPFSDTGKDIVAAYIWTIMFIAVLGTALVGAGFLIFGSTGLLRDKTRRKVPILPLAAACVLATFILPAMIRHIRYITADIYLIIWWILLEASTIGTLYSIGRLDGKETKKALVRASAFTIVSLAIYIVYPFPPEYVGFVLGAVPIVLYAFDMALLHKKMG